jgi:hypothetical protein
MRHQEFDSFARSFVTDVSRRSVVRAFVGGASIAAQIRLRPAGSAEAACTKVGAKCEKGDKCCGGAKCKGQRCRCLGDRVACGNTCCQPGQVCQEQAGGKACANGDIAVNDACDPAAPLACETGVCGCFGDQCTCREAACGGPGAGCLQRKDCCDGFCVGQAQVCSQD